MPTIKEIAAEAKVSMATVSRVFSNHPNVKETVREHVLSVARRHNYVPRLSNRRRTVILITPSRTEHPVQSYVDMVTAHLAETAGQRGYRIEILPEDNHDRLEYTQFCAAIQISAAELPWENWSRRFQVPLILIDRETPKKQSHVFSVRSNEKQGMELAIEHLVKSGHRRIGCLVSNTKLGNAQQRVHFIQSALATHGLPSAESFVRLVGEEAYMEETAKLLRHKVDAIFAPGGMGGIITAYALNLLGRRVPEDISLIASERAVVSRYCLPPQTTITQNYRQVATMAVDAIDASLKRAAISRYTVIDYQLMTRESVVHRLSRAGHNSLISR
ncbi:LacI family DNA-binding transcriptional regulator [Ruficoccus amylovorans]|uniref:LacI family DNA-binding transcriptional regulator n=1 Tax=Ruficoccus amylovorans TaxID=1804625 RepID=A0A842HGM4_9BACT|nr:LacI family DNA-binding transcriptional regulator [Ruficoccus amylovorans]MBC2595855.1 LacI family DNA-binding transcriptional regulator [Ruficoccus amylovorans]